MKCTLCGYQFEENQAERACKCCPFMKGCKLIRCPNCGFEAPKEPQWLKHFKKEKDPNDNKRKC